MARAMVGLIVSGCFTASLTSCDGMSHENGMISKASPEGVEAVIQTAPMIGISPTLEPIESRMARVAA